MSKKSKQGRIIAGALAPHPPHLVYASNPPQNEPKSQGGWETLRWGYDGLADSLNSKDYDVLIVHSPHWRTIIGHHLLGVESFKGLSVDPIFPNLFRYDYDLKVDVDLAKSIAAEGEKHGLEMSMMENPEFRVDYGTIISCHLANPKWDKPIVAISSGSGYGYFSRDVGDRQMLALGEATKRAVEASGKRAVLLASTSLSHRHFTTEPEVPEDMSHEHIYNSNQNAWDMHMLDLMKKGESQAIVDIMPDFIEHAVSECDSGSFTWLLGALGMPTYGAKVHAYGTVIGTGNAIVEWDAEASDAP